MGDNFISTPFPSKELFHPRETREEIRIGTWRTKLFGMGDNYQSMYFLSKDISTRENHARRSEGGPKVAPVEIF